jgi:formylglycine-generating enzyme required for sulfatase activity/flavodoxin
MREAFTLLQAGLMSVSLCAYSMTDTEELRGDPGDPGVPSGGPSGRAAGVPGGADPGRPGAGVPDGFVFVEGGTFAMGSPESEQWRGRDETLHEVTLDGFYMGRFEVTRGGYAAAGRSGGPVSGKDLPVADVSWHDAIEYCNALSAAEGLEPAYAVEGGKVTWNRAAAGYRLPTEAEWEYACRAGTRGPFSAGSAISPGEANFYGHYPYRIEDNYFSQGRLEVKPGVYRESPVPVGSFPPNKWGLYDTHGNVGEWCWDFYGRYGTAPASNPSGPREGGLRVIRGGGWNDFAKHLRSAYRSALPPGRHGPAIGFRLARNAEGGGGPGAAGAAAGALAVAGGGAGTAAGAGGGGAAGASGGKRILVAYFSWGGNTRGIALKISGIAGADIFEIRPAAPYPEDYNAVLDQAQREQKTDARPELENRVGNMEEYGTVILGYPNWWASIPMPVATFLESYDFSGKTVLPFCSHGGGRFGQSLAAIAKLAPGAELKEGLSVSYSGGRGLSAEIAAWLKAAGVSR